MEKDDNFTPCEQKSERTFFAERANEACVERGREERPTILQRFERIILLSVSYFNPFTSSVLFLVLSFKT